MKREKLRKSFIDSINAEGIYYDAELPGFYLRCAATRAGSLRKTFLVNAKLRHKKTIAGKRTNVTITIGTHGIIGADEARRQAKVLLAQLAQGVDPRDELKAKAESARQKAITAVAEASKKQLTLRAVLEKYLEDKRLKLRPKTVREYRKALEGNRGGRTRTVEKWLDSPIASISGDDIKFWYLAESAKHLAQTNATLRVLRLLFNFALSEFPDVVAHNPVERLRNQDLLRDVKPREGFVRPEDFGKWLIAVETLENRTASDFLQVLVFTGLRFSEAASLKWSDVNLRAKIPTLTVVEPKNHEIHVLPLPRHLLKLFLRRERESDKSKFVFPGTGKSGHISDARNALRLVEEASGILSSTGHTVLPHDLRRTFSTAANCLDIGGYTVSRLLNHKRGARDITARYVQVTEMQMLDAMEKISAYLLELRDAQASRSTSKSKIVAFKRRA